MSFTVIDDFIVPDSLEEGARVDFTLRMRNTGDVAGRLDWYIEGNPVSPDRYVGVEAGTTTVIEPGARISWGDVIRYFPMPAWDFVLTASNEDGSSTISRTIKLGVVALGEFRFDSWNPGALDYREVFIVGAVWPAEVRIVDVGEDVYAYYVIKNVGTVAGEPKLTVKDLDTGLIIKTWDYPELAPNARFKTGAPGTYIGKMPSSDWRLEFKVEP